MHTGIIVGSLRVSTVRSVSCGRATAAWEGGTYETLEVDTLIASVALWCVSDCVEWLYSVPFLDGFYCHILCFAGLWRGFGSEKKTDHNSWDTG